MLEQQTQNLVLLKVMNSWSHASLVRSFKLHVNPYRQEQTFADFFKIGVLKHFLNFTGKHLCGVSFQKETPSQVLSCETCEVFKSSLFYRTPPVAASA